MTSFKLGAVSLALLAAAVSVGASAAVPGTRVDDTEQGVPQFTGPPPEIVPIGSVPTDLQARDAGVHRTRTSGSLEAEWAAAQGTEYSQLSGPAPEIVPIGSVPSAGTQESGAAPSAASFYQCVDEQHNGLCLWQHIDYGGIFWFMDATIYSCNVWHYVGNANNRTSSMYNKRTNATLISRLFPPSMPDIVCVPPQAAYADLTEYAWPSGKNANDTISGFDFIRGSC